MEIFTTNDTFNFENLIMTKPTSIAGGNYFIRCLVKNQPLYIQPPKCKTRQGIVKPGVGKRFYSDLLFTNENEDFIRWMENLENYCQQYIYKNREKWFDGEMDLHDIENYFTSPLKLFKSGKYYIVRTNITTVLGKPTLKIYDENETEQDFETINENTNVMTILEVQGIKCSSKSFQIEIELKQMMVLAPTNMFEKCIIRTGAAPSKVVNENLDSRNEVLQIPDGVENKVELEPAPVPVESINAVNEPPKGEESRSLEEPTETQDQMETSETMETTETLETQVWQVPRDPQELEEVEFNLEKITDDKPMLIKKRDNIYYEMYREAKKKAKAARDLALSAYLEAKRIKNTYLLEDMEDDDDEEDDYEYDEEDDEDEDGEETPNI
jgi:hypothetical protein